MSTHDLLEHETEGSFELNRLNEHEPTEFDDASDEDLNDDQKTFLPSPQIHTLSHSRRPSDLFSISEDHLIQLPLTELSHKPTSLEKNVTFWNGLSLVVGLMIGSGIFASPGPVAQHTGSVGMSLLVWLACGLLACTGALSYAELGAEIPLSGGEYAYLQHAYGDLPAFLFSWTAIVVLKVFLIHYLSYSIFTVTLIINNSFISPEAMPLFQ